MRKWIISSDHPSVNIHIRGNFNIHLKELLFNSVPTKKTDNVMTSLSLKIWLRDFLISLVFLTQLVITQTSSTSFSYLTLKKMRKSSTGVSFHGTVFRYHKTAWDIFTSYMAEAQLSFKRCCFQNWIPHLWINPIKHGQFYPKEKILTETK